MKVVFLNNNDLIINSYLDMQHLPLEGDLVCIALRATKVLEKGTVVKGKVKRKEFYLPTNTTFVFLDVTT